MSPAFRWVIDIVLIKQIMLGVLLKTIFAIVYTAGYLMFTLFTIGAGHGTTLILSALPTWIVFVACVVLLARVEQREIRIAIMILMALHYAVTFGLFFAFEVSDGFRSTIKYFESEPMAFSLGIAWYVAGQVVFWVLYYSKTRRDHLP